MKKQEYKEKDILNLNKKSPLDLEMKNTVQHTRDQIDNVLSGSKEVSKESFEVNIDSFFSSLAKFFGKNHKKDSLWDEKTGKVSGGEEVIQLSLEEQNNLFLCLQANLEKIFKREEAISFSQDIYKKVDDKIKEKIIDTLVNWFKIRNYIPTEGLSINDFEGVSVTSFMPLISRAKASKDKILVDDMLSRVMIKLLKFDNPKLNYEQVENNKPDELATAVRTKIFTDKINSFVSENPDGVVVNLGCGLDNLYNMSDNGRVEWYDIDMPNVIDLKRNFSPETKKHHLIGSNILDFSWMEQIPKDKKILFVSEGVLMYFTNSQLKQLIDNISQKFGGKGVELTFESPSPLVSRISKKDSDLKLIDTYFELKIGNWKKKVEKRKNGTHFQSQEFYMDKVPEKEFWGIMGTLSKIPGIGKKIKQFKSNVTLKFD